MSAPPALFFSSGNVLADKRYYMASELLARGDLASAADLLTQTLEIAPGFASAWFMLGDIRERLEDRLGAIAAFRKARDADAEDRLGSRLRLARLNAGEAGDAMPPAYVRTLFDQYAARFDEALTNLAYRGPALLLARGRGGLPCQRPGAAIWLHARSWLRHRACRRGFQVQRRLTCRRRPRAGHDRRGAQEGSL